MPCTQITSQNVAILFLKFNIKSARTSNTTTTSNISLKAILTVNMHMQQTFSAKSSAGSLITFLRSIKPVLGFHDVAHYAAKYLFVVVTV